MSISGGGRQQHKPSPFFVRTLSRTKPSEHSPFVHGIEGGNVLSHELTICAERILNNPVKESIFNNKNIMLKANKAIKRTYKDLSL